MINIGWAYEKETDRVVKMAEENMNYYREIKDKAILKEVGIIIDHKLYDVVEIKDNKLTNDELALIASEGNLCFGYKMYEDKIAIKTSY